MDKLKFFIESSLIPLTEVKPVSKGVLTHKRESGKAYYSEELKDKIKFNLKPDFDLVMRHRFDEGSLITLTIQKLCKGQYVERWAGTFSIFESTINENICWVEPKLTAVNPYRCIEDFFKTERSLYAAGGGISVVTKPIETTIEEQTCSSQTYDPVNGVSDCLTDPANWALKSITLQFDPFTGNSAWLYNWHREIIETDCVGGVPVPPQYGSGWALLNDDCVATSTSTYWRAPLNNGQIVGPYNDGRMLSDVLEYLVSSMTCGLTLKSDFFNVNPLGDAPTNIAYTYAVDYLHNMTIHQKSDIKRKDGENPSTSDAWVVEVDKFFEDLQNIFQVYYIREGNTFILEHASFFDAQMGMNLESENIPRQYDFSGNEGIYSETYNWADEVSYSFKAVPILYPTGTDKKDYPCNYISTDLAYIENEFNVDKISDEGFVLISNGVVNSELVIIEANHPMKYRELQPALFTYNRLFRKGSINLVPLDFDGWKPYIKAQKFKVSKCCDTNFDPKDLIKTKLGEGVVENADIDLYSSTLELEMKY